MSAMRHVKRYTRILYIIDQVLKNGDIKIGDIRAITRSEKLRVSKIFNKTNTEYDDTKTRRWF